MPFKRRHVALIAKSKRHRLERAASKKILADRKINRVSLARRAKMRRIELGRLAAGFTSLRSLSATVEIFGNTEHLRYPPHPPDAPTIINVAVNSRTIWGNFRRNFNKAIKENWLAAIFAYVAIIALTAWPIFFLPTDDLRIVFGLLLVAQVVSIFSDITSSATTKNKITAGSAIVMLLIVMMLTSFSIVLAFAVLYSAASVRSGAAPANPWPNYFIYSSKFFLDMGDARSPYDVAASVLAASKWMPTINAVESLLSYAWASSYIAVAIIMIQGGVTTDSSSAPGVQQ